MGPNQDNILTRAIFALRKKVGFTQKKAAERMNVTTSAWRHWEKGRDKPTLDKAIEIGQAIDEDKKDWSVPEAFIHNSMDGLAATTAVPFGIQTYLDSIPPTPGLTEEERAVEAKVRAHEKQYFRDHFTERYPFLKK